MPREVVGRMTRGNISRWYGLKMNLDTFMLGKEA